ncbi:MAG: hypothetical protein BWX79_03174 [Alphaproteobacteria bacterium ADurb.Bin100]|nr:MAG: hypothetical protein BWX79_03174 [Alphaproteobacteria bacterium ADurb.Bin100]
MEPDNSTVTGGNITESKVVIRKSFDPLSPASAPTLSRELMMVEAPAS